MKKQQYEKKKFNTELNKILNDKTSGSTELLQKINLLIKKNLNNKEKVKLILNSVKKNLSTFEIINSYIKKIETSLEKDKLLKMINSFDQKHNSLSKRIYQNAKPFLKDKNYVLTLSNSKTLLEVFKLWRKENKNLKVVICESRPKEEGKVLAKNLLSENIKVEIITDAMISIFIPKVDAVIIGADKILKNKNVVNKVGSRSAAILCKYFGKPFYVISSGEKFSNKNKFSLREESSSEIWAYKNKKLKITNIYFEEIEKKFITKIITD